MQAFYVADLMDSSGIRDLNGFTVSLENVLTIQYCYALCFYKNFSYAGLQYG